MKSFVNLMANDVWSEADIKARLHAEIRSEISEYAEQELNRALQGKILGMHTMTTAETALLMAFKSATDRVAALGVQARADAALLAETLHVEVAQRRLSQSPVTEIGAEIDAAERLAAQAVVDAASPEALALYLLRNPASEEVAA